MLSEQQQKNAEKKALETVAKILGYSRKIVNKQCEKCGKWIKIAKEKEHICNG